MEKYGEDEGEWVPSRVPSYCLSSLWGNILRAGVESSMEGNCFVGVGFRVADGRHVHFWLDDWLRVGLLSLAFSSLFRVVVNKGSFVNEPPHGQS